MFLYWKSECHNLYSTDRLDAIEWVAAVAEAVAAAAAAAVAIVVVSERRINAKLNTQNVR